MRAPELDVVPTEAEGQAASNPGQRQRRCFLASTPRIPLPAVTSGGAAAAPALPAADDGEPVSAAPGVAEASAAGAAEPTPEYSPSGRVQRNRRLPSHLDGS